MGNYILIYNTTDFLLKATSIKLNEIYVEYLKKDFINNNVKYSYNISALYSPNLNV